eukprot:TRINITY_DN19103_c0_g3_i1.p1 TRINITY_DN19103_c0_g3~~TRINITY_DN19103_c0_g3_i1.p1  ORF type:complete len:255 (+),score=62.69 TRINITY_DN19103_c0_g3_i1:55-819(+)
MAMSTIADHGESQHVAEDDIRPTAELLEKLPATPQVGSPCCSEDRSTICTSAAVSVFSDKASLTAAGDLPQAPADMEPVILSDVKPFSKEVASDPTMAALLEQARELSQACFKDDCLDGCSKRGGWRISLLAGGLDQGAGAFLLGFVVYRLKPEVKALSVSKLAVPDRYRRRGYGRIMMQGLVQQAKQLPEIETVSLSSLPDAITFYQRLGFKRLHVITAKDATDTFFPGQVYMELRTPNRGGKKSAPKPGQRR